MGAEAESAGSRLEELSLQVRDLEQRVSTLETRAGIRRETIEAAAAPAPQHIPEADPETASVIPVFGKALLGLAAAYLLRAMSEAGALPLAAGVAVAIAYSLGWLWLAARNAEADPRGAAVRAVTSVLILIPVLWEAHVRFQAMSSWTTAAALTGFPAAGLFVSWRKNLTVIVWISTLAGLISGSACSFTVLDAPSRIPYKFCVVAVDSPYLASEVRILSIDGCWRQSIGHLSTSAAIVVLHAPTSESATNWTRFVNAAPLIAT